MNQDMLTAISQIVAQSLNSGDSSQIGSNLNSAIPASLTLEQRAQALEQAVIYSLVAEQPGYPDDGQPGYLPMGADLKAAVLQEIDAMIRADFDKEEHRQTWQEIRKSVAATPEADFAPGVAVNCPDDYLLTLDKLTCADLLRQKNILPAWA